MTILRDSIQISARDDVAWNISRDPLVEIMRGTSPDKKSQNSLHGLCYYNLRLHIKIMVTTQKISLKFCKINYY